MSKDITKVNILLDNISPLASINGIKIINTDQDLRKHFICHGHTLTLTVSKTKLQKLFGIFNNQFLESIRLDKYSVSLFFLYKGKFHALYFMRGTPRLGAGTLESCKEIAQILEEI
jgi:hypothetical protein